MLSNGGAPVRHNFGGGGRLRRALNSAGLI